MHSRKISGWLALCVSAGLMACTHGGEAGLNENGSSANTERVQMVRRDGPPRNQCRAEAVQDLVGQPYEPSLLETALESAHADQVRMLRPDMMVTKEYLVGRLNLMVDEDGLIERAYCG